MCEACVNKMQDFIVNNFFSFYLYVFCQCFTHTTFISKEYKPIKNTNYNYYCQIEAHKVCDVDPTKSCFHWLAIPMQNYIND